MNARTLLDVKTMLQTPEWKVFAEYVEKHRKSYAEESLQFVEDNAGIYACERAKSAELILRCLLPDFLSWLDSEIKNLETKDNA